MKNKSLAAILAGLAVGAALFVLMWWIVGSVYAAGMVADDLTMQAALLFLSDLGRLVVGLTLVVSLMVALQVRDLTPGRAALCAAFTIFLISDLASVAGGALLLREPGFVAMRGGTAGEFFGLIVGADIACIPLVLGAALVALIASLIQRKLKRDLRLVWKVAALIVLAMICLQGIAARRVAAQIEALAAKYSVYVDKNLVRLPPKPTWRAAIASALAGNTKVYPRAILAMPYGYVQMTMDGEWGLGYARLELNTTGMLQLRDRKLVCDFLRSQGVREPIVQAAKPRPPCDYTIQDYYGTVGVWVSHPGLYPNDRYQAQVSDRPLHSSDKAEESLYD